MAADEYDPLLGLIQQGTGNNNNSWGTTLNNQMISPVARAIAGLNTITTTGGTTNLDDVVPPAGLREDVDMIQDITGNLVSAATIVVPNVSKVWVFRNSCTGNFFVYVKTPSGNPTQIPAGTSKIVFCDGNDVLTRMDKNMVGKIFMCAGPTSPGDMVCSGASLLRTDFPDLFEAIGTTWGAADGTHFNVPDFVTNNRFPRASGGSLALATYQASQNKAHTHTGSGTTGNISADHTHGYSGSTGTESADHTHNVQAGNNSGSSTGGGAFAVPPSGLTTYTTGGRSAAHTHSFSGTTGGVSSNHTHNFSFTTSSDGGTEARPEAAAVLFVIRF